MDTLREYFSTLMAVALLTTVLGMLSPSGNIKKYVRLAGAFCLLCALVAPWGELILKNDGISEELLVGEWQSETVDYEEIYRASLLNGEVKNAQAIVKNRILNRFSLSEDTIDVQLAVESREDTVTLSEVTLLIRSSAVLLDPRELTSYVNEEWGCPCVVIYD